MGHYVGEFCTADVAGDFKRWWKNQKTSIKGGCDNVRVWSTDYSDKTATEARTNAFIKKAQQENKKKGDRSIYWQLEDIPSFKCVAFSVGVVGYQIKIKRNKIVNHHRQVVEEVKTYKTKPSHIPEGGRLEKIERYVFSYDMHDYFCDYEDDEWDDDY